MAIVRFPDGTRVRPSSISERRVGDPERTYGLYLDPRWQPTWPATMVDGEDFGLPENPELAAQQITDAFGRARQGERGAGALVRRMGSRRLETVKMQP